MGTWGGDGCTCAHLVRSRFRGVLRFRHTARLAGDLVAYAVINRVWWILPLILLLAVASLVIVIGQAAAPVTLYPMF